MARERIALVEDDPDLSATLVMALERDGYQTARYATGRDGLEGILGTPPDLVLLDLNLPDLDGLGVCRELRETDAVRDLPIIMLTARVEESDRVLGLDLGRGRLHHQAVLAARAQEPDPRAAAPSQPRRRRTRGRVPGLPARGRPRADDRRCSTANRCG